MFLKVSPDECACAAHETFDDDQRWGIHGRVEEAKSDGRGSVSAGHRRDAEHVRNRMAGEQGHCRGSEDEVDEGQAR